MFLEQGCSFGLETIVRHFLNVSVSSRLDPQAELWGPLLAGLES